MKACFPALAAAVCAVTAHAQNYDLVSGTQIGWATEAFAPNFMADGVTTFEQAEQALQALHADLGAFRPGFDPATADVSTWASNWVPLQTAEYDSGDQQFIGTANLIENTGAFAEGQAAWIWVYNSKDFETTSEWLLVSAASWRWPAASSPLPTVFSMSDAQPQDALFGAVNDPGGQYHMQLQSVPVPEVSTSLVALGGLALCLRRRGR